MRLEEDLALYSKLIDMETGVINIQEMETVSEGERRSFGCIAKGLNAEGIPTRTGKPWIARTVWGILKREGSANA